MNMRPATVCQSTPRRSLPGQVEAQTWLRESAVEGNERGKGCLATVSGMTQKTDRAVGVDGRNTVPDAHEAHSDGQLRSQQLQRHLHQLLCTADIPWQRCRSGVKLHKQPVPFNRNESSLLAGI